MVRRVIKEPRGAPLPPRPNVRAALEGMIETWRREAPSFPIDEAVSAFEALPNKEDLLDDLRINMLTTFPEWRCEARLTQRDSYWPLWVIVLTHPTQRVVGLGGLKTHPHPLGLRAIVALLSNPARSESSEPGELAWEHHAAGALLANLEPLTEQGRRTIASLLDAGSPSVRSSLASAILGPDAPMDAELRAMVAARSRDPAVTVYAREAIRRYGAPEEIARLRRELEQRPDDLALLRLLVDVGKPEFALARFDHLPEIDPYGSREDLAALVQALVLTTVENRRKRSVEARTEKWRAIVLFT